MVVGGLYDSESCYGAWNLYKAIKEQSPDTDLYLTFGPWWHGAWTVRGFQGFGNLYFGKSTSAYYMDNIEYPFFRYFLEGKGGKNNSVTDGSLKEFLFCCFCKFFQKSAAVEIPGKAFVAKVKEIAVSSLAVDSNRKKG